MYLGWILEQSDLKVWDQGGPQGEKWDPLCSEVGLYILKSVGILRQWEISNNKVEYNRIY